MANILQLIGLAVDLIGVFVMAYDIVNIDKRTGTVEGLAKAKEIAEQTKRTTMKGLFIIGGGFILQAAGTIINICHAM